MPRPYDPSDVRRPAAAVETGLAQLAVAIEALQALEDRLLLIEDQMTDGQALELPTPPKAPTNAAAAERRLAESAAVICALTRRLNLRLGGVERALDGRPPLDGGDEIRLRSSERLAPLPGVRSRYGLD